MATLDLNLELQKEQVRLDAETEKKLCTIILQRMNDVAGEISELAVKCLAVLVQKIHDVNLAEILRQLIKNVLAAAKEPEISGSANIGLKAVINSVDHASLGAKTIVSSLTPRLIEGMLSKSDDVVLLSLDIARDFVAKFGTLFEAEKSEVLLQGFLNQLQKTRVVIGKKATACIGVLSAYLTLVQLDGLCVILIENLQDVSKSSAIRTSSVQCLEVICCSVNYRMGKHVESSIALIMDLAKNASEEDIDMTESCIRALESFMSKCPLKAKAFIEKMIELCLHFLQFDPNYSDDIDEDEDEEMQSEDEETEMYSDEEVYSDDEDDSWKVRKASMSCLVAIFVTSIEQIYHIYRKVGPVLISRFREREENVRIDVLQGFIVLLRLIREYASSHEDLIIENVLEPDVTSLMKQIDRQLKEKSLKTRLKVFHLLKEIAVVLPKHASNHTPALVSPIIKALTENSTASSDLKLAVLTFLQVLMQKNEGRDFSSILLKIAPMVFRSVNERYYKVAVASLQVALAMVYTIRPSPDIIIDDELATIIPDLFSSVVKRLIAQDVDQEVKEHSIKCIGHAVAILGDFALDQVETILQVLLERLKNETMRLTTVKTLTVIGKSPLALPLDQFISPAVEEFTNFLKKANMFLRQASLSALEVFCGRAGPLLQQDVIDHVVQEAASFVNDNDLHLASTSLDFFCTLAAKCAFSRSQIKAFVIPQALILVQSPILQGTALDSLKQFFVAMLPENFDFLFQSLISDIPGKIQQTSIACCVAAISTYEHGSMIPTMIPNLLNLTQMHRSETFRRLALLCLGEIGRLSDLNPYPDVERVFLQALEDASDNVKNCGSYAYGAMTFGNLPKFLPELVHRIQRHRDNARFLYLLFQSLLEVLTSLNRFHGEDEGKHLEHAQVMSIKEMLLSGDDLEEETRNVVAECLGQLVLLDPMFLLPQLKNGFHDASENIKYITITAIRHAVVDQHHAADQDLRSSLGVYLNGLADPSRHVRKASVQLLSSALAQKYNLVEHSLTEVLPKLYQQTAKNEEYLRVLDFGPFKHKIDDGLELRKASFECMNLLLDVAFDKLNVQEFLTSFKGGLSDDDDVKLLSYALLIKFCKVAEAEVSADINKICDPLQKTIQKNISQAALKHEHERHQEIVFSCLRLIDALSMIPGVPTQPAFKKIVDYVMQKDNLKTKYDQIKDERLEVEKEQKPSQDRSTMLMNSGQGLHAASSF